MRRATLLPQPTARLRFDWWENIDQTLARTLWSNDKVTKFIGGPFNEAQIVARLSEQCKNRSEHGVQYWPIFRNECNSFVGCCGLRPRTDNPRTFNMGFHLVQEHWGQRLATEAGTSVIAHAFEPLGADAIFMGHRPGNESSRKTILRLGFTFDYNEIFAPTGLIHPRYKLAAPSPHPS
mmetsp:Transcript_59478/g.69523  ORF Transcript_59478/g.69523 Transcript_59478/m.69523 type:complete len:179 (-) Transcript_59478:107-643(-)